MSKKNITEETRLEENRGTGEGAGYKPWLNAREVKSTGVRSILPDWIHGRMIQLLSQAERNAYLCLRWDDNNVDIREQFPLMDIDETNRIADEFGYKRVNNGRTRLTTDMMITKRDGSHLAVSVKKNTDVLDEEEVMNRQRIEERYWKNRNIPWILAIEGRDVNLTKAGNINLITGSFKKETLCGAGRTGLVKHLLANKVITEDLTKKLDLSVLVEKYRDILNEQEAWLKAEGIIL